MEEEKILPCCKCGKIPRDVVEEPGNLFYVRCRCNKWSPYEAIGLSRKKAIQHWNNLNRDIKRVGHPK